MSVGRETAKGQIFEGGFARQWFIKKHLFKDSPIPVSDSQFDRATSVSPCLYKWMGRGAATRENRHARPTAIRPRVAVIEVIAILCPVNPPIPFVPPRRSSSPRRFPSPPTPSSLRSSRGFPPDLPLPRGEDEVSERCFAYVSWIARSARNLLLYFEEEEERGKREREVYTSSKIGIRKVWNSLPRYFYPSRGLDGKIQFGL